MTSCDEIRIELGAYALGALELPDVESVEAHLAGCQRCRAELDGISLASDLMRSPGLHELARTSDDDVQSSEHALAGVAAARAAERRHLRRLTAGIVGTGAALLVTVGVAATLGGRPVDSFAPTGVATALRAAPGVEAAAQVELSPRPWGTQVDLIAEHLPDLSPGAYYEVWLVRPDGSRVAAGTFRPTAVGGKARVRLASALGPTQVVRVGVTREGPGGSAQILGSNL